MFFAHKMSKASEVERQVLRICTRQRVIRMLIGRMIRAAKLDVDLYEEVEADASATPQAFLVVLLSSVAQGIGAGFSGYRVGGAEQVFPSFISLALGALLAWVIWAALTYWIGVTLFRGPETSATYGELLRTIGYSASPGILRVFSFLPFFGPLIVVFASFWMLVAMVIAVRQALDFTTARAIGTCLVGWLVQVVLLLFLLAFFAADGLNLPQ